MTNLKTLLRVNWKALLAFLLVVLVAVSVFLFLGQFTKTDTAEEDWTITESGNLQGWEVYILEDGKKTYLTQSEENGWQFSGLTVPGQVYYMSRTLGENVHSPHLTAGAIDFRVCVFLDEQPIYLHPLAKEPKIGSLYYEENPDGPVETESTVSINLPAHPGQVLTLGVQSLNLEGQLESVISTTLPVVLYPSFLDLMKQNSAFDAASTIPMGIVAAVCLCLLILFFLFALYRQFNPRPLILALVAFCLMAGYSNLMISSVDYLVPYYLVLSSLFVFYASMTTKKHRWAWAVPVLYTLSMIIVQTVSETHFELALSLRTGSKLVGLATLAVWAVLEARSGSWFYRWFCRLFVVYALGGLVLYIAAVAAGRLSQDFLTNYHINIEPLFEYFLLGAGVLLSFVQLVRYVASQNVSIQTLTLQTQYAQQNVRQLKNGIEESRRMRHEVAHHLEAMGALCGAGEYGRLQGYIADLQNTAFLSAPLAYSQNGLVNAIVTTRFQEAERHGIQTNHAILLPETLGISDIDLASFLSNLLDNAIDGALQTKPEQTRKIALKMSLDDKGFLFISCENSCGGDYSRDERGRLRSGKKGHYGLGLQVMRQIAEKYNSMLLVEAGDSMFSVKTNLSMKRFKGKTGC